MHMHFVACSRRAQLGLRLESIIVPQTQIEYLLTTHQAWNNSILMEDVKIWKAQIIQFHILQAHPTLMVICAQEMEDGHNVHLKRHSALQHPHYFLVV